MIQSIENILQALRKDTNPETPVRAFRLKLFALLAPLPGSLLGSLNALAILANERLDGELESDFALLFLIDNCKALITPGRMRKHKKISSFLPDQLAPRSTDKAVLLTQNQHRGHLWERQLVPLIAKHYVKPEPTESLDWIIDKQVFDTKVNGKPAKRRVDIYVPQRRLNCEIKSGRVIYKRSIREQIHKDQWLLQNGHIEHCVWFLHYGASLRVVNELDKAGIDIMDLGFDDNRE